MFLFSSHRFTKNKLLVNLCCMFLFFSVTEAAAEKYNRYYVDSGKTVSGNGTSWELAFKTIHEAVVAATQRNEIWIKKGTYLLTEQIVVNKAVSLLGGFSGTENNIHERDWHANQTIIDGQEKTRCLLITQAAYLDALTITRGRVTAEQNEFGGGILITNCSPTIKHCSFTKNQADFNLATDEPGLGGAIYTENSHPFLQDCRFENNLAGARISGSDFGRGGAIYIKNGYPVINACNFINNHADGYGGGLHGGADITHSSFSGNTAFLGGGAINTLEQPCSIIQSSFDNNQTDFRGGGFQGFGSLLNCLFNNNVAGDAGGGVSLTRDTTLFSCRFFKNIVTNDFLQNLGGGSIFIDNGTTIKIINSIFSENQAGIADVANGGAIYNNGNLLLLNCTLWGNQALTFISVLPVYGKGGAIYNSSVGELTLVNSILWGNIGLPAEIGNDGVSQDALQLYYTNIDQDGFAGINHNMRRDPLFVAPLNSDFHLSPDSPAIDAGYNAIVAGVLSDFEGDRRIINGRNKPKAIVDLGADEFKP